MHEGVVSQVGNPVVSSSMHVNNLAPWYPASHVSSQVPSTWVSEPSQLKILPSTAVGAGQVISENRL